MKIIDAHAHLVTQPSEGPERIPDWMFPRISGIERLLKFAQTANIDISIISSTRSLQGDLRGEDEVLSACKEHDNLYMYLVLNPESEESWRKARKIVKFDEVAGVKVHPTPSLIKQYGDKIFSFAKEHNLPLLFHTGVWEETQWAGNIHYCLPFSIVKIAEKYPDTNVILSDKGLAFPPGHCALGLYLLIDAIKGSTANNLYLDTGSIGVMFNLPLRIVINELGSGRIVFGSDSPMLNVSAMYKRVDAEEIPLGDKQNIFHKNAEKIFKLQK